MNIFKKFQVSATLRVNVQATAEATAERVVLTKDREEDAAPIEPVSLWVLVEGGGSAVPVFLEDLRAPYVAGLLMQVQQQERMRLALSGISIANRS